MQQWDQKASTYQSHMQRQTEVDLCSLILFLLLLARFLYPVLCKWIGKGGVHFRKEGSSGSRLDRKHLMLIAEAVKGNVHTHTFCSCTGHHLSVYSDPYNWVFLKVCPLSYQLRLMFVSQGSTLRKRKMYEEFLSKVSILGKPVELTVDYIYVLLIILH